MVLGDDDRWQLLLCVAKERKPGQRAANPLPAWDMLT